MSAPTTSGGEGLRTSSWLTRLNPWAARREALAAERAVNDTIAELSQLSVREFTLTEREGLRAQLAAECVPHIAMLLAAHFRSQGGVNYVEMLLRDPVTMECFTITTQRVAGQTPHQAREETERALTEARAEVMALRRHVWLGHGCPFMALYGDDGEMSCGQCLVDFKRDSIATITAARRAAVGEPS